MNQLFKSIYFIDHPEKDSRKKNLKVAFNKNDVQMFNVIKSLSSEQIRELMGFNSYKKLKSAADKYSKSLNSFCVNILKEKLGRNLEGFKQLKLCNFLIDPSYVTFKGSKDEPFHSWFGFLEGYSPQFVQAILDHYASKSTKLLDPFSGQGTTAIVAAQNNIDAFYCEINPLMQFITQAKVKALRLSGNELENVINKLKGLKSKLDYELTNSEPDKELFLSYRSIFSESCYFNRRTFSKILSARTLIDKINYQDQLTSIFLTIAILSNLIPCSLLIRAGDIRFKTEVELKKENKELENLISNSLENIINDLIGLINQKPINKEPLLISEDAKQLKGQTSLRIDTVITSPPYLNGTNYLRNTKIELWFLRCIRSAKDLQTLRFKSITAGINDVRSSKEQLKGNSVLQQTINKLENNIYDNRIPKMIGNYFYDMNLVFDNIKQHLENNSVIAIDIGDSVYNGIHVPTDKILIDILRDKGYNFIEEKVLRKRLSRSKSGIKQSLLIFNYLKNNNGRNYYSFKRTKCWRLFKESSPHQKFPYCKRNWGHPLHSLCSYEGKMKPSLAFHLIKTYLNKTNGTLLDPFGGVGTIPFEAALSGHMTYMFEISPLARIIATAKLTISNFFECKKTIDNINDYIQSGAITNQDLQPVKKINFNRFLSDYFEKNTLNEIILARKYFLQNPPKTSSEYLVMASLLHILHGNRPYALSRRSHNTTPFAPTGKFEYRPLIPRLLDKVNRSLQAEHPKNFIEGKVYDQDATLWWPHEVDKIDAIITSPPFFDSTRFYMTNWLRLWFCGWEREDFEFRPKGFIDTLQKKDFSIYRSIFRQARERLNPDGIVVLHLGKSKKCNMADELIKQTSHWFKIIDCFEECVKHCENHGLRDKGTVEKHQYLILG